MKNLLLAVACVSSGLAFAEGNHIGGCHENGLGCKVINEKVDQIEQAIHAEYKVTYRFTCGATLNPYASKIYLHASTDPESKAFFNYMDSGTLSVTGRGPLRIGEVDKEELSDVFQPKNCGLFIDSVTVTPSKQQTALWDQAQQDSLRNLKGVRDIYGKKATILFWTTAYSKNPDTFRPLLEKQIETLKKEANGDFLALLTVDQYQAILDQAPDLAAKTAEAKLRDAADSIIIRAEKLQKDKAAAGVPEDATLKNEIELTKTTIGPKA